MVQSRWCSNDLCVSQNKLSNAAITSTIKISVINIANVYFLLLKKNYLQGSPLPCSDSVIWCHLHVNICLHLQCSRGGIAEKLYDHQINWSELVMWTYLLQRGEGNVSREGKRTRTISEVTSTTPPWLLLRISAEISQWEISLFLLLQYCLERPVESLFNRRGEREWVSMGSADWQNCSSQYYSHCIRKSLWDPDLLVWPPSCEGRKAIM